MWRAAAWQPKNTPLKFTAHTASRSSSEVSITDPLRMMPATLTITSSRPRAASTLGDSGVDRGAFGHVDGERRRRRRGRRRSPSPSSRRVAVDVDTGHVRPGLGEANGGGRADPAAGAGDDGDATGERGVDASSSRPSGRSASEVLGDPAGGAHQRARRARRARARRQLVGQVEQRERHRRPSALVEHGRGDDAHPVVVIGFEVEQHVLAAVEVGRRGRAGAVPSLIACAEQAAGRRLEGDEVATPADDVDRVAMTLQVVVGRRRDDGDAASGRPDRRRTRRGTRCRAAATNGSRWPGRTAVPNGRSAPNTASITISSPTTVVATTPRTGGRRPVAPCRRERRRRAPAADDRSGRRASPARHRGCTSCASGRATASRARRARRARPWAVAFDMSSRRHSSDSVNRWLGCSASRAVRRRTVAVERAGTALMRRRCPRRSPAARGDDGPDHVRHLLVALVAGVDTVGEVAGVEDRPPGDERRAAVVRPALGDHVLDRRRMSTSVAPSTFGVLSASGRMTGDTTRSACRDGRRARRRGRRGSRRRSGRRCAACVSSSWCRG